MTIFQLVRPIVHALDGESAHRATVQALALWPRRGEVQHDPRLGQSLAGLDFRSPVGLAAGFDKDAQVPGQMLSFGFGSVEVGTLTPRPQAGNPKPRLFRLEQDRAVINRMGFNNGGVAAAMDRLRGRAYRGIVGVNIGANKESPDRISDYVAAFEAAAPLADYITVNISSPNTPGLRALQDRSALIALLDAVLGARMASGLPVPIFLKVAPDLEPADIDDIAQIAIEWRLDALIISNTTISRPGLRSRHAEEAGGLSGAPLRDLAQQRLRDFRNATGGAVPLIGVGGIANAADAWARIKAGASLVQLYSALVYEGPGLANAINRGLLRLMEREGFSAISEAVGKGEPL